MDCKDIERLLTGKPVAELTAQERADLAAHAAQCVHCREKWHVEFGTQEIHDLIKGASTARSVKDAVMDRLKGADGGAGGPLQDQPPCKAIGGFEIISQIGRGGMGTVFKARQVSVDRIVALKVLSPKVAKDEVFVQRFIREARSAAKLNHPNIVQAIDVGCADGCYYYAMEFVDGITLRQLMRKEGQIAEGKALKIVAGVARALEHAQKHGIVHRDIKPENIMISREGVVKLADLGLARSYDRPDTITVHGRAVGTPYYMSPEQARGETDVDTRADIYSLGATLYHMLTGEFPFDGPTSAVVLAKHLTEPVPSPKAKNPALSGEVCELVRRMMEKKKEQRPQNPTFLLRLIQRLLGRTTVTPPGVAAQGQPGAALSDGTLTPHAHAGTPLRRQAPRWSATSVVSAVVVILLLGAAIYWGTRSRPSEGARLKQAETELNLALSTYRDHPNDLEGVSTRFRALVGKYPDTEFARRAQEELARIEQQQKTVRAQEPQPAAQPAETPKPKAERPAPEEPEFQAAKTQVADFLKRNDFKAAAALLARTASDARLPATRIAELRASLIASATAAIELLDKQAQPLLEEGKHTEATGVYQDAGAWGINEIQLLVQERIARIEAAKTAALRAARASFAAGFKQKVAPLLAERRYKEAKAALEEVAAQDGLKLASQEIEAARKDVERLLSFWEAAEKTLASWPAGHKIRIKGMLVAFSEYRDGRVFYKIGPAERGILLGEMTPGELLSVLGEDFLKSDEARLQAAAFLLFDKEQDLDQAEALLGKLPTIEDAKRYGQAVAQRRAALVAAKERPKESVADAPAEQETEAQEPAEDTTGDFKGPKWVSLFDGKSLAGWRALGEQGKWAVRTGNIVGAGAAGPIVTESTLQPPYTLSLQAMTTGDTGLAWAVIFGCEQSVDGTLPSARSIQLDYRTRWREEVGLYDLKMCRGFPGHPSFSTDMQVGGTRNARFLNGVWHDLTIEIDVHGVSFLADGVLLSEQHSGLPAAGAIGLSAPLTTRFRNIRWSKGVGHVRRKAIRAKWAGAGEGQYISVNYECQAPEKGYLAGLRYTVAQLSGGTTVIRSIQPVYRTPQGLRPGHVSGTGSARAEPKDMVVAKPGYAVGGFVMRTRTRPHSSSVDALKLVFMRVLPGTLDPNDKYESNWLGMGWGGVEADLLSTGRRIIGLYGDCEHEVRSIGFIESGEAPEPAEPRSKAEPSSSPSTSDAQVFPQPDSPASKADHSGPSAQQVSVPRLSRLVDGYVVNWEYAGPYQDVTNQDRGGPLNVEFPPERQGRVEINWRPLPAGPDPDKPWLLQFDQMEAIAGKPPNLYWHLQKISKSAIYLRTSIHSPAKQQVQIRAGSDDGIKIWLNNNAVHSNPIVRPCMPDSDKIDVTLNEGWNDLLVKVSNGGGNWAACIRFVMPDGRAAAHLIADPARKAVPPPGLPSAPAEPALNTRK